MKERKKKKEKRLLRPSCLCWRHHGDIPVRRHRSRLTIASRTARTTQGTRAQRLCTAAHPSRNWYATIWPWNGGSCRPKICTICAARAPPTRTSCPPRTRTTWWPPTIDRCSIPGGIGWGRVRSCFYPPRSPKRSARSIYARNPTIPNEGRDPRRPSSPRSDQLGIPCCRCRSNSRRGTGRSIEDTPSRNPWPRCSPSAGWTIPKLSYGRMWYSWEGRPCSSGPSVSPGSRRGSYFDTSRDRFAGSCAADPIISRTSLSGMWRNGPWGKDGKCILYRVSINNEWPPVGRRVRRLGFEIIYPIPKVIFRLSRGRTYVRDLIPLEQERGLGREIGRSMDPYDRLGLLR